MNAAFRPENYSFIASKSNFRVGDLEGPGIRWVRE